MNSSSESDGEGNKGIKKPLKKNNNNINNNNESNNNNINNNNFKRNNNNKNRMSPLAGVHIMRLGDRMAVINATRELTIYFNSKYEHYGNFIRNEEYSPMPVLDVSYIDVIEGIAAETRNSLLEKEIIENRKEIKRINNNKKKNVCRDTSDN